MLKDQSTTNLSHDWPWYEHVDEENLLKLFAVLVITVFGPIIYYCKENTNLTVFVSIVGKSLLIHFLHTVGHNT